MSQKQDITWAILGKHTCHFDASPPCERKASRTTSTTTANSFACAYRSFKGLKCLQRHHGNKHGVNVHISIAHINMQTLTNLSTVSVAVISGYDPCLTEKYS